MELASLAYRTDLTFVRFDGRVDDRGGYLVARSPANPDYYWGNFVVFGAPPEAEDVPRWEAIFRREHAADPRVRHVALGWDGDAVADPAVDAFVAAGYELTNDVILRGDALAPPPGPSDGLVIRPLAGDADWAATAALNERSESEPGEVAQAGAFRGALRARYRAMVEAGQGVWFGAFGDGALRGQLGLFRDQGIARFQNVETDPSYRQRGVCTQLFAAAVRYGLSELGASALVIVATPGGQAERIYRRAGFREVGRQLGAHRGPGREGE